MSASTIRNAMALAKFGSPFRWNEPTTSLVSSRSGTAFSYPCNPCANNPALFGNFLGAAGRALRKRM
jgi:hypothetical protein